MAVLLKLNDVEVRYGSGYVLRGVSFEVRRGQIAALLGANGAGKTTVIKTIMRLLDNEAEEQPAKGTIEFAGRPIHRTSTHEIVRMGIGYVPQGRELFPELTVRENLIMGAYTRKDKREIAQDIELAYHFFPILGQRQHQQAGYLSGGEQQVLAIARALLNRPVLLTLDEPCLGLSPVLTHEIFAMIRTINEERGLTILLIEQNANLAFDCAHYAFLLDGGKIVRSGRPETLRGDRAIKDIYLAKPTND